MLEVIAKRFKRCISPVKSWSLWVVEDCRQRLAVSLSEHHAGGIAPRFTQAGFQKPDRVQLITQGRYQDALVSPRSSREYGVPINAEREIPQSLELAAGILSSDEILAHLDPGIYISNLWYCNFSDPNDARITGVTRYACFWVEDGKPKHLSRSCVSMKAFIECWVKTYLA